MNTPKAIDTPQKSPLTYLMFSKTQNLHFFTMTTNMNPTKVPQKEKDQPPKKLEENPKSHRYTKKVSLNLPDVLHNHLPLRKTRT